MANKQDYILPNHVYDVLKYVTQIVLPALGTLYFALSDLWGLPKALEVVGTTTAVVTFLGVVLGLSTRSYNHSEGKFDGNIFITPAGLDDDSPMNFSLESDSNPIDWQDGQEISFKIVHPH